LRPSDEELSLVRSREVVEFNEMDKKRIKDNQNTNTYLPLTDPNMKNIITTEIKAQKNREIDLHVKQPISQDNRSSSSSQTNPLEASRVK